MAEALSDKQAAVFETFTRSRSRLNAELSRNALADPLVGEIVGEPTWDTPLRFFAALHYLVLDGRAQRLAAAYAGQEPLWPAVREALAEHREWVSRFVAEQPVQTNEVGRCWALLPGFLTAAQPGGRRLDLVELGPSAGLNLLWDRYRYRYERATWGDPDSPLELRGEVRGTLPSGLFATAVEVRRRTGIDRAPIDVTSEQGARLLQAFVWADQPERLERMRRAIDVVRADPPELLAGDYVELLPRVLAARDGDALTVVYSSASTQYLSDADFARLTATLEEAGTAGGLAWLAAEPPRETPYSAFSLELRQWPGGERRRLASVHYHGEALEWLE